tara:strand:+ start:154 stop:771 length:618 start_codon:yes stop_codon:yes gene_type:complete
MAIVITEKKGSFIDKLKSLGTGSLKKKMSQSMDWFREKVRQAQGSMSPAAWKLRRSLDDSKRSKSGMTLGMMYFYTYNPKYAEKLPYYDRYPLIFPYKYVSKPNPGWWGINLHYLFLNDRALLMDVLMRFATDDRLQINEGTIKQMIKSQPRIIPCTKRYLNSQVIGKGFIEIEKEEWDSAFLLPVQQFKKASDKEVWKQSKAWY